MTKNKSRHPDSGKKHRLLSGAVAVAAVLGLCAVGSPASAESCDRACISGIVDNVIASMVKHDPDTLPLATEYLATENSHPASLGFMTAWRTITKAGKPDLIAIDEKRGGAYFALPVSEGGETQTALYGRVKIENKQITEIEIFLNRSKGDHGFSFGAEQMPKNYLRIMQPPATRQIATRDDLEGLAQASFDATYPKQYPGASDCQFTEAGSLVIDPGLDDVPPRGDPTAPLQCFFGLPPTRPVDPKARTVIVDEKLGIVVAVAMVPGTVYPYPFHGHMVSAFIPTSMGEAVTAQDDWIGRKLKAGKGGMLRPTPAIGETMQVLQYYDGKVQAEQINVYLNPPGAHSAWVKE